MVECQLPKLDVAGSTPVSRSNFSITWEPQSFSPYSVYSLKATEPLTLTALASVFESQSRAF